jgi:hypothetical protein
MTNPVSLLFTYFIKIFLCSLTLILLHFSHDWSNWSSPSFSSTTFQNFFRCFWSTARSVQVYIPKVCNLLRTSLPFAQNKPHTQVYNPHVKTVSSIHVRQWRHDLILHATSGKFWISGESKKRTQDFYCIQNEFINKLNASSKHVILCLYQTARKTRSWFLYKLNIIPVSFIQSIITKSVVTFLLVIRYWYKAITRYIIHIYIYIYIYD